MISPTKTETSVDCWIDCILDRLIDWSIDWLIDWLLDWWIDCLIDGLIAWLMDWLIDWLIDWSIDWLIHSCWTPIFRLDLSHADHYGDTPLHWAARQGQKITLDYLLSSGVDAALRNSNHETALCQAVRYGHKSLFTSLLTHLDVSSVNTLNGDGDGILHLASWYGSTECLRELTLADEKFDINLPNSHRETALHICAAKGAAACVRQLVASGADVDAVDGAGAPALVLALRHHHLEIAQFLLTKTKLAVIDRDGCSLLHRACESGEGWRCHSTETSCFSNLKIKWRKKKRKKIKKK